MWRWIKDDVGQEVLAFGPGEAHSLSKTKLVDAVYTELNDKLEIAASVWGILYAARAGFVSGGADYVDAAARLRALVPELASAQRELDSIVDIIFTYLDPSPAPKIAQRDQRAMLAKEILSKLK